MEKIKNDETEKFDIYTEIPDMELNNGMKYSELMAHVHLHMPYCNKNDTHAIVEIALLIGFKEEKWKIRAKESLAYMRSLISE